MDLYAVRNQLNNGVSLTNIKLRVVDYSRVSTDSLTQKKSLQNQVEHFDKYIKENPNWIYVCGYVDDGISGTTDVKRDNFMRMIEDAKKDKFDLIVTKEISRFSRNTLDSIKYTRELLSYGVAVFFVNDNINTALCDSELRLTIMASMAQDEIRRLSERVKFGMNRAIERGEILGNDMLYGYKKNKTTGRLDVVVQEAEIVKRIYELYGIEELSLSKITKVLNSEYHKGSIHKKWCVSTISRMIENPKYKGYYCGKKSEIVDYMTKKVKYFEKGDWVVYEDKDKIPPIVDDSLWDRANLRLIKRKKEFQRRKEDREIYKNRYLYSTKIYCAAHNSVFYRRIFRRNKSDVSWICSKYLVEKKDCCQPFNIRESELDFIFNDLIKKLNIDVSKAGDILGNLYNYFEVDNVINEKIQSLEKKIEQIILKKEKLFELNFQGNLSDNEFMLKNNLFNERIDALNCEMDGLKEKCKKINNNDARMQLSKNIEKLVNSKFVFTKIVSLILDRIMVSSIDNDNVKLDIFLSYKVSSVSSKDCYYLNSYEFMRGYDTRSTKRYKVNYLVNYYFNG